MIKFYSCMLSQDVTPLNQLTEQANLQNFKIFLSNKHLQEALVFTASSKSHGEIESARKKPMFIFFKGNSDHFLIFLGHKQLIWKVTTAKSFIEPEALPPTKSTLRYHSFQRYFQKTQQKKGSKLRAIEQHRAVKPNNFLPVLTDLEATTRCILKIIRCRCKIDCSSGRSESWKEIALNLCLWFSSRSKVKKY